MRRGFTLVEILVTVVILGIAAALVIPATGSIHVLRVQAAVRQVVSDLTFAQSDAMAYQERRAIIFDVDNDSYSIVAVPGDEIDADNNTLYMPDGPGQKFIMSLRGERMGGADLIAADFDDDNILIFDALGGPVKDAAGEEAGAGGIIRISGSGQVFTIRVDAFTGRVSVEAEAAGGVDDGEDEDEGEEG